MEVVCRSFLTDIADDFKAMALKHNKVTEERYNEVRNTELKIAQVLIQQIRKDLKIQAVKAAKEKAQYLASAIDEQVGVAVTINEPGEAFYPMYANVRSNKIMAQDVEQTDQAEVDFSKIKYKFEVTVVFALK